MGYNSSVPDSINPELEIPNRPSTQKSNTKREILIDGFFYDVSKFSHPGGDIIKFYVNNGEDATTAFQEFHNRSIRKAELILKSFSKREANVGEYKSTTVSLEKALKYHQLTKNFREFHKKLESLGYFDPSWTYICIRLFTLFLLVVTGFYLATRDALFLRLLGLAFLAVGSGQSGWVQHEGGHYSFTGRPKWDRFMQSMVLGLGTGFSSAWWRAYHNRHHAMPQRVGKDEDVNYLPLIAFNKESAESQMADAASKFFVRNQKWLYYPLDGFLIILWWRIWKSPRYAIHKRAYLDLFFMSLHLALAISLLGIPQYVLVIWLTAIYTLGNLALNHTHLPVTEEEVHWVEHALVHTVDVQPGPGRWVDYWMGYINYHIIHHLFPSIPLFRGAEIMPLVQKFAHENDLPCNSLSYWDSVKATYGNIVQVSKQLSSGNF